MHNDDEYLESKVLTASPYDLHLMVVDGAIRHAVRAEQALEQADHEAAHFALNESRGFIAELISGLNPEQTPELIDALVGLFLFAFRSLVEADLEHDAQKVREARQVLEKHREAWVALGAQLQIDQRQAAPEGGPPPPHSDGSAMREQPTGRSWTS